MGGRLDATNVVDWPLASVITPVSDFDRRASRRHASARSRGRRPASSSAGVPAIVAAQPREALAAIERQAARLEAPIRIAGEHWTATEEPARDLVYQDEAGLLDLPGPRLYGRHQSRCRCRHRHPACGSKRSRMPPVGIRGRDRQGRLARAHAAAVARTTGRARSCRRRVVARRRAQRGRRARHRQCTRQPRRSVYRGRWCWWSGMLATKDSGELPEKFHRPRAPSSRRECRSPARTSSLPAETVYRGRPRCHGIPAQPSIDCVEPRRWPTVAAVRARSAAAHPRHRLALSRR